ncbi:LamG domain-containing protein, partial [Vibrio sp.]|uniref:LamG domain-containing protein n=1 Tax=Vibrio sp. TaxID=678 RepID=UPI003D0B28C2
NTPFDTLGSYQVGPGAVGNAVFIQGAGDRLEHAFSGWQADQFSVSFWMKLDYAEGVTNYTSIGPGWDKLQFVVNSNNAVRLVMNSEVLTELPTEQQLKPIDQWNQWTLSYDGDTLTAYQNGQQVANISGIAPPAKPWWNFKVEFGKNLADGSLVTGGLDEFRVYDRPLTSQEAWQLYDNPEGTNPGQISLTLPTSPGSEVDNTPVTGSLYHFAS